MSLFQHNEEQADSVAQSAPRMFRIVHPVDVPHPYSRSRITPEESDDGTSLPGFNGVSHLLGWVILTFSPPFLSPPACPDYQL